MKILRQESNFTKLCHAKPGDVISLVSALMETDDKAYMVGCVASVPHLRAARDGISHGLYDDKRQLFLLDLETGLVQATPHLSSRVIIYKGAALRMTKQVEPDREAT